MKMNNSRADFVRFFGVIIVLLSVFFENNIYGIVGLLLILGSVFFEN